MFVIQWPGGVHFVNTGHLFNVSSEKPSKTFQEHLWINSQHFQENYNLWKWPEPNPTDGSVNYI